MEIAMSATDDPLRILIAYYSRFGVLKTLAEQIAEGAHLVRGVDVDLLEIEDLPVIEVRPDEDEDAMHRRRAALLNRLAAADAIVVGSPSYFGSMASPVKRLFEDCLTADDPVSTDRSRPWRHHRFRDKVGAAFTASGTPHGGNEQTLQSILTMFMHLGMIVVTPGQRSPILQHEAAPYGATAISGAYGRRPPPAQDAKDARALGERVAHVASWIRAGHDLLARHRAGFGPDPAAQPVGFDPSA
jgi:NAD(P)H dehydrogenase (quinone)